MNHPEKCPLCDGEGFDSGGVEFNGLPTPPLPCPLCIEREARQKAEVAYKGTLALLERRNGELGEAKDENQKLHELCESLISKLDHSPYCRLSPKSRPCDCHVSKAYAELESLNQLTK